MKVNELEVNYSRPEETDGGKAAVRIKDLDRDDQPRERALKYGIGSLATFSPSCCAPVSRGFR